MSDNHGNNDQAKAAQQNPSQPGRRPDAFRLKRRGRPRRRRISPPKPTRPVRTAIGRRRQTTSSSKRQTQDGLRNPGPFSIQRSANGSGDVMYTIILAVSLLLAAPVGLAAVVANSELRTARDAGRTFVRSTIRRIPTCATSIS